jgi:methionyl-tRNA formyltransferase
MVEFEKRAVGDLLIVLAADYVGWQIVKLLMRRNIKPLLVVCHKRDPGGYNQKITEECSNPANSEAKVVTDDFLRDPGSLERLRTEKAPLGLLAWWPDIIRGDLLNLPLRGWVNLHPSFLPYNRGKHPNFWCIVQGTPCGVALHFASGKVDCGDVIARAEIPLSWEDTGESVYRKSREKIVALFDEHLDGILRDSLSAVPQENALATSHLGREIEVASMIDLDKEYLARDLLNIIRAKMFRPHRAARFQDGEHLYEIEVTIREVREES